MSDPTVNRRLKVCLNSCDRCTGKAERTPVCGVSGLPVVMAQVTSPACPLDRWPKGDAVVALTGTPGVSPQDRAAVAGPALWAELHRRSLAAADLAGEAAWAETAWLARFAARVPCGECRRGWRAWVAANPPDLSSPAAYFAWTWEAHSAVNAKLGKPLMSLVDARARWSPP